MGFPVLKFLFYLFIYLCLQVENVLKMITVYDNFDFIHIFPVMGEKYCYVAIVYRVIEVPKANKYKYAGSIGAD